MQNKYQTERSRKKSPSLLTVLGIGAIAFFTAVEELSEDVFYIIVALLVFAVPVLIVVSLLRKIRKYRNRTAIHTHDRIDHQSDIRINPRTGKAAIPVNQSYQHSAREHWKQQLDGLLANGTIDRAEYRALLDRKF